jgi:nucleoside-diphosphate-sugar epimerase
MPGQIVCFDASGRGQNSTVFVPHLLQTAIKKVMPRTVLITGGAGFIGSSLAAALVSRGDTVRVLDNFSSGRKDNLRDVRVDLINGDILDADTLKAAAAGVEVIFHEAALPSVPRSMAAPLPSHEANATGTLRVLEAARAAGVRRVVYAGSSSAYGDTPVLPKVETMVPNPLSPYAVGKLTGELYCRMYARTFGLETVVLRYFNVFGPRQDPQSQYAAVIPRFITAALTGAEPVIFGDGTQSRDFCFIDNVVEANIRAAEAPADAASGRVFNVACGAAIDLNAVVKMVGELTGRPLRPRYEAARAGDVKHSLADIREAETRLGYRPQVDFAEGLRRTVAWLQAR